MAEDAVTYIPNVNKIKKAVEANNIKQGLEAIPEVFPNILPAIAAVSQAQTPEIKPKPKEQEDDNTEVIRVHSDPNIPLIKVPKGATNAEIKALIEKSTAFKGDIFNAGYLYDDGFFSKYDDPENLDDSDFTRKFKGGINFVQRILPGIKRTFGDLINNESIIQSADRTLKQMQLDNLAETGFMYDDQGEVVISNKNDLLSFMDSDNKFGTFAKDLAANSGNALATLAPLLVSFVPVIGPAMATAYLTAMGIASVQESQLERTDDPNLWKTIPAGVIYGHLERIGLGPKFLKSLLGVVGKENLEKTIPQLMLEAGVGTAKTTGKETITEVGQTAIEEIVGESEKEEGMQAVKDLFSNKEFGSQLLDSAYQAFTGSIGIGAAGSTLTTFKKPPKELAPEGEQGARTEQVDLDTDNENEFNKQVGGVGTLVQIQGLEQFKGTQTPVYKVNGVFTKDDGKKYLELALLQGGPKYEAIRYQPVEDIGNLIATELDKKTADGSEEDDIYFNEPSIIDNGSTTLQQAINGAQARGYGQGSKNKKEDIINEFLNDGPDDTQNRIQYYTDLIKVIPEKIAKNESFEKLPMELTGILEQTPAKQKQMIAKYVKNERENSFISRFVTEEKRNKPIDEDSPYYKPLKELGYIKDSVTVDQTKVPSYTIQQGIYEGRPVAELNTQELNEAFENIATLGSEIVSNDPVLSADQDALTQAREAISSKNDTDEVSITIKELLNNTRVSRKQKKTDGILGIEEIIKNKIPHSYRTKEEVGQDYRVIPPEVDMSLESNKIKYGYSIIEDINSAKLEQDLVSIDNQLKQNPSGNVLINLIKNKKMLLDMKILIRAGKGADQRVAELSFLNKKLNKVYNAKDMRIRRQIITQLTEGRSPRIQSPDLEIRQQAIRDVSQARSFIQEANDIQYQFNVILKSLDVEPLTQSDFAKSQTGLVNKLSLKFRGSRGQLVNIKPTTIRKIFSVSSNQSVFSKNFKNGHTLFLEQLRKNLNTIFGKDRAPFLGRLDEGYIQDPASFDGDLIGQVFLNKDVIVNGYYGLDSNSIYVASNAFQADLPGIKDHHLFTLHHEAIHALFNLGYFTSNEIALLKKVAKENWMSKYSIRERYGKLKLTEDQMLEEAISDAFASYMDGSYQPQGRTLSAFDRIKKMLQAVGKTLFDLDFTTPEDIFEAAARGELAKRKEALDKQVNERTVSMNTKRISKITPNKLNDVKESVITERTEHFGSDQDIATFNEYYNDFYKTTLKSIMQSNNIPTDQKRHIASLIEAYELLMTNADAEAGIPDVNNLNKIKRMLFPIIKTIRNTPMDRNVNRTNTGIEDSIRSLLLADPQSPSQKMLLEILQTFYVGNTVLTAEKLEAFLVKQLPDIETSLVTNTPQLKYHGSKRLKKLTTKDQRGLGVHLGNIQQAESRLNSTARDGIEQTDPAIDSYLVNIKNPIRLPDMGNWIEPGSTVSSSITKFNEIVQLLTIDQFNTPYNETIGQISTPRQNIIKPIFTQAEANGLYLVSEKVLNQNIELRQRTKAQDKKDPFNIKRIKQYADERRALSNSLAVALKKAITDKGYDGIVYRNNVEGQLKEGDIMMNENILYDSHIAFDADAQLTQTKSFDDTIKYSVSTPNVNSAEDPVSDKTDFKNNDSTTNDVQINSSISKMRAIIQRIGKTKDSFEDMISKGPEWFSKLSSYFSHPRSWGMKYGAMAKLYNMIGMKEQYVSRLQNQAVMILNKNFNRLIKNKENKKTLFKAMEISQQPDAEGKERSRAKYNNQNQLVFTATENGRGINSEVKSGETVILEGEMAEAYLDVQEALGLSMKEYVNSVLSQYTDDIRVLVQILSIKFPDNPIVQNMLNNMQDLNNPEVYVPGLERMPPRQLIEFFNLLQDIDTKKVNANLSSGELDMVNNMLLTKTDQAQNQRSGLAGFKALLARSLELEKKDYIPLQRFGTHFVAVKQDGKIVEYVHSDKNRIKDIYNQLRLKYGADYEVTDPRKINIDEMRANIDRDFNMMDSIAQNLTNKNSENYVEIRKEINRKLGGTSARGIELFFKGRKEVGGVRGFSTNFDQAISNFITTTSEFSSSIVYDPLITRAKNKAVSNARLANNLILAKGINDYYEYVSSPKEEWAGIRRLGFRWYLGGNFSSALLQLVSLIQFTGPIISQFANSAIVSKNLSTAFNDVRKIIKFRGTNEGLFDYSLLDKDIQPFVQNLVFAGLVNPNSIMQEAGMPTDSTLSDQQTQTKKIFDLFDRLVVAGPFNTAETTARLTAAIGLYKTLLNNPSAYQKALELYQSNEIFKNLVSLNNGKVDAEVLARVVIQDSFGEYGKKNKPYVMRSGLGGSIFLFATYITQMYSLMARMAVGGKTPESKKAGRRILAKMLLMIFVTGGLMAMPGADDAAWLYNEFKKRLSGIDGDVENELRIMINEYSSGPKMTEAFMNGSLNAIFDIDIAGRLGYGQVPYSTQGRVLLDVLGLTNGANPIDGTGAPGAIFMRDIPEGLKRLRQGEGFWSIAEATTPIAIRNVIKTSRSAANGGIMRSKYGTVISDDLDWYDYTMQAMGIAPGKVARGRQVLYLQRKYQNAALPFKQKMNAKLKNNMIRQQAASKRGDSQELMRLQEEYNKILREIMEFNAKHTYDMQYVPDLKSLMMNAFKDNMPILKQYSSVKGFDKTQKTREAFGM